MRRLVVLSALFILAGLLLLLSSVPIWSLLTTGSTSSSGSVLRFGSSSGTDTTTTESVVAFGLVGVGLILEVFSLFTDVGGAAQASAVPQAEKGGENP